MNGDAKKQQVFERLQSLAVKGRLTSENVVADAKKKTSPLHSEFDWDDASAAHHWRIEQAGQLIRSFKVYIERRDIVIAAPAFVRDPEASAREQGYRETTALKNDAERAREVLVTEAGRAAAHLTRVRALAIALDLEEVVDDVLGRFTAFRRMVERP